MASVWCEALVCWLVVVSLSCSATSTTTITPDPDTEQPLTTQQSENEKEEGSDRFLGFGGNSFGSYDVGSSFFGSSGYQVHQQQLGGLHHYPSYRPGYNSYPNGHHPTHHYDTHSNFIPSHGGIPLHPGQDCKYYCLWSTRRHQYCCDSSPSYTGYLCPQVREEGCPGINYRHSLQFCSRDLNCPYRTKCCFDACVNAHVCKTPQ